MDSSSSSSNRALALTFIVLMALLAAAVAVLWLPRGPWNAALSLVIAAAKTTLIVLIFMRARSHGGATLMFIFGGFIWVAVLFTLTFADYWTR